MRILSGHKQLQEDSCAAAGMELILKLHEIVAPDWFEFQNEFGNQNIKFNRLDCLSPYGINAKAACMANDKLAEVLRAETQAGRFPLVAIPGSWIYNVQGGPEGFHVWATVPDGNSFMLVAGGYKQVNPDVKRFEEVMKPINDQLPGYPINHVQYTISPPPSAGDPVAPAEEPVAGA